MCGAKQILMAAILVAGLAACSPTKLENLAAGPTPSPTEATEPATIAPTATHKVDVPGGFTAVVPVTWKQASFDTQAIAHSTVLAYFSTEPISNPCSRSFASTSPAASARASCHQYAVDRLEPDGVLVSWTVHGLGGQGIDWTQGQAVTVGGSAARLIVEAADADCSAIIGERLMVMRMPGGQPPDFTEMRACYLGPDLDTTEAQLRAFLASIVWH